MSVVLINKASYGVSGQPDLHGRLLGVREMLCCLSYALSVPSAPSGTLTMLRLASPVVCIVVVTKCLSGESDGRCVRALGPISVQRSILYLLLNPPSNTCFNVLSVCTLLGNVAHFFPSHSLHLDLTFWGVPILLTIGPLQGELTTAVYRRGWQERVRLNGDHRF